MFTVPGKNNPLAQALGALAEGAAPMLQRRKAQKSSQAVMNMLSNIKEDANPLEFVRALYSNPEITPEDRTMATKGYHDLQMAQARMTQANRSRLEEENPDYMSKGELNHYTAHNRQRLENGEKPLSVRQWKQMKQGIAPEREGEEPEMEVLSQPQEQGEMEAGEAGQGKPAKSTGFRPSNPPYTGKRKAEWQKQNSKHNLKTYEETVKRLHAGQQEQESIDILSDLNESGKLPKDMSKFTIDPETGDFYSTAKKLDWPTPEAERYVKTLANMLQGIKDTFGARVTNFDVQSFMRRFPTLMNTEEGRRQILQQITLVNKLNSLHDNAVRGLIEKYKSENISPEDLQAAAREQIAPEIEKVKANIKMIGKQIETSNQEEFQDLPPAGDFAEGDRLKDSETGKFTHVLKNGKWQEL